MKGGAVMLYVLKEWQGSSGLWYCEHTDSFPKDIQKWIIPARLLGVTANEFIKILIKDFQPDKIFHNEDCSFVGWAWKKEINLFFPTNVLPECALKQ